MLPVWHHVWGHKSDRHSNRIHCDSDACRKHSGFARIYGEGPWVTWTSVVNVLCFLRWQTSLQVETKVFYKSSHRNAAQIQIKFNLKGLCPSKYSKGTEIRSRILGKIGPLVVIITLVEFFHPGTLARTLMSGSFKGSGEGWACIIFNTSD